MKIVPKNTVFLRGWRRYWQDEAGQGLAVEYAVTFIMAVAAIVSMSIYVQRALRGRIRDAHFTMLNYVSEERRDLGMSPMNIYMHYEPYYAESNATRSSALTQTQKLQGSPGVPSGIYTVNTQGTTAIQTTSNQLSPLNSDQFVP